MNDTDARRRNHWVSHIARHAHEKPGAVYLRFEGGSVTWASTLSHCPPESLPSLSLARATPRVSR